MSGIGPRSRAAGGRLVVVTAAVVAIAALLGATLAAPATVTSGTPEQGLGGYVGDQTPAYWPWESTYLLTIPTPVPGQVSVTVGAPTVLAARSESFTINAATAGATALRWVFDQATTVPHLTELELRFVSGLTTPAVTITVYVETRGLAPPGIFTYTFYWDAGTFAPSGITVESMVATVLACTSVGHCP